MARVVGRAGPMRDSSRSNMRFSEVIVIGVVIAGIAMGVRGYLAQRNSAAAAVQNFFQAVKTGNVDDQYAMVSDDDKAMWCPDVKAYKSYFKAAEGFVERIQTVSCGTETPDPSNPNIVSVLTTIEIRPPTAGKELWQGAATKSYTDTYKMKKDDQGKWKICLFQSMTNNTLNLLSASPDSQ